MSKTKPWKRNKSQAAKQQLHEIKSGSVKKNKSLKFKNTPMGKVTLIDSKAQKNAKFMSPKNVQKNFSDAKNQKQDSQASKNSKQLKHGSPSKKQKFSNKAENKKTTFKPKETFEEQFDDSSSDNEETTSQEDISMNKSNETFEEDSDTDTPDIFGKSLADEDDEDDEDFEEEEKDDDSDEEDYSDSDDSDKKETVKYKGVKMFEGLKSKAKKNDADKENQENGDDDDDDDYDDDEDKSDETVTSDESDEDSNEEMEEDDGNDEKQNIKNRRQVDTSLMKTDEENDYNDDSDKIGMRTLLKEKPIEDSHDDDDFYEEDEDDDVSIGGEEEKEKVIAAIREKANKAVNQKETQVEREKIQEKLRPLEKKVIVVENIPVETTKVDLLDLFNKYGGIKQIILKPVFALKPVKYATVSVYIEDFKPKQLSLTGIFLYSTEESALNAAKDLHRKPFAGNCLFVQTLTKFNSPFDLEKVVVIANLPQDVRVDEILEAFRECGDIDFVEVRRQKYDTAVIHFFTKEAAYTARSLCNVIKIRLRRVIVFELRAEHCANGVAYRDDKLEFKEDWYTKWGRKLINKKRIFTDEENKQSKKFKPTMEEPEPPSAENKRNVEHKKQQEANEGEKSTAFQGQKANLKNKKKKNRLDKKKKKMAEKLLAKTKV